MKITQLDVEGFRSFKSQTWRPGDLNVLIGPNASGKSNLLRVLEFLGAAAQGGLGSYVQHEGGMEALLWDGREDRIRVQVKMSPLLDHVGDPTDPLTFELVLSRLGRLGSYSIEKEHLGGFHRGGIGVNPEPFKLLERDIRRCVAYSKKDQTIEASVESSMRSEETFLSLLQSPLVANWEAAGFQTELADWRVHQGFDTNRDARIRAPQVTRSETQVSADGQNLVSVLHSLYSSNRDFEIEINTALRAAFGDDFEKLVFPPAADQRIQMRIRWRSLKREQSAADLSDGTLRFLFLMAVLANPSPPPLIAIDEPETGLHPSMLPIVAEYAREAASKTQVILTTHSPEFLDAFGEDPPTTTVVERRDGETVLRVVSDDELSYWLKNYSLGELYRSKELEAMT